MVLGMAASLAWLFLVGFGSLVAFTAYIWLLGVVSIAKAGTYAYVNLIVAVILAGVALVNVDWGRARQRGDRARA